MNPDDSPAIQSAVEKAEAELADSGRIVLRASGTEPVIRVMVEGSDSDQVGRLAEELAEVVAEAAA
jgi:phosphoglucosamine mutase